MPDRIRAGLELVFVGLGLLACAHRTKDQSAWHPGMSTPRKDVKLLGVCLAFKVGSQEAILANDSPKVALPEDTILVYPVVQVALGDRQQDTVYLTNTIRLASLGCGWNLKDRVRILE